MGSDADSSKILAVIRLLKEAMVVLPAQAVFYASALAAIVAFVPSAQLPAPILLAATSLGANTLASILERIALGEQIPAQELGQRLLSAIRESGISDCDTSDEFHRALAQVLAEQRVLRYLVEAGEARLAAQLGELYLQNLGQHAQLVGYLRTELEGLARREDVTELRELVERVLQEVQRVQGQATASALHQLREPRAGFTGRQANLVALRSASKREGLLALGIYGMGGVGKTELALMLAHDLKDRYCDAQFLLDLRGTGATPVTAAEAMAHVIRSYNRSEELPASEPELTARYRSLLHGRHVLLLMDNAKNKEQVEPLIPPIGNLLLVTSRFSFYVADIDWWHLGPLLANEASALLATIAPRAREQADTIASLCGNLPLALRAAGAFLAVTPDADPADYATQLQAQHTRLERIGAEGVNLGVPGSLNLSYEQLDHETARVFRSLAAFPASFDAAAEVAVSADPDHCGLSKLVRYNLVDWDASRYSMHDLVRLFAQQRASVKELAAAQQRHAAYYAGLVCAADCMYMQGHEGVVRGLALFDHESANISAGQTLAASRSVEDKAWALICSVYPEAATLLLVRQRPYDHGRWLEAGIAAAQRLGDRAREARHCINLAGARAALGDTAGALETLEHARTIAQEIGDRYSEAVALNDLGSIYFLQGHLHRAIGYHERALDLAEQIGEERSVGYTLGNLAADFIHLGDPWHTLDNKERRLQIVRHLGSVRGEAVVYGALGVAHAALGDTRTAIQYVRQSAATAHQIGDRHIEATGLAVLARIYCAAADVRGAVQCAEQALAIAREFGDRRSEGSALGVLGLSHARLGQIERSTECCAQQLAIASASCDSAAEAGALWTAALAMQALGNKAVALSRGQQALAILEQTKHPAAEDLRRMIADWYE